ncbi:hypothetical protein A2892_01615 [Candidatus Woesebacteria bacterium RIFCSPLOWO2_01_FULL_39_10b]|uniref:ZIP zinc transporter n=1 Tax=Candidatus Woesebacteria bacterium RIFCSPLOWO2_01_FULL_39_10b TaxID=1802517 RepID=A0A1F8B9K1_9BACT|nr:MAG: hypothetical protein A2892_01615 [Candidatus Woesebacteria bacterium RIFCSPLOWO2_01_FULL_39_10b]
MNSFLELISLAFLGSMAGLIGGVIFLVKKDWARKLSKLAVPFASGVLLSVSILHLIPEAEELIGEISYLYVLLAFLVSFIFEQFFTTLHHHEDRKSTILKTTVPLVIVGDTIHNFIDGVAIAAAYLNDPAFGLIVALATFFHETPHEIGDFGVLISSGWSRSKTFIANALSASATFPGALFVFFFNQDINNSLGLLLAVSAGVFLYLGASDFLPEIGEEKNKMRVWKQTLLVVAGAGVMYFLTFLTPEP